MVGLRSMTLPADCFDRSHEETEFRKLLARSRPEAFARRFKMRTSASEEMLQSFIDFGQRRISANSEPVN